MTNITVRRFTALAGILGVILYVAGDLLIADLPPINAPAQTVATYAASHQAQFLAFVYLW